MPLHTRIVRDGKPLQLQWSWWHVGLMFDVSALDTGVVTMDDIKAREERLAKGVWDEPAYTWDQTPLGSVCRHEVRNEYRFHNPDDGETLELQPGDLLEAWR